MAASPCVVPGRAVCRLVGYYGWVGVLFVCFFFGGGLDKRASTQAGMC